MVNNRHTLCPYQGLNQSKIVKDETSLIGIGLGPDILLGYVLRVCMFESAGGYREVSSLGLIEAHVAVGNEKR